MCQCGFLLTTSPVNGEYDGDLVGEGWLWGDDNEVFVSRVFFPVLVLLILYICMCTLNCVYQETIKIPNR